MTWIPAQAGMDDLERFLCITGTNFHLSEELQAITLQKVELLL
jgi:hypothetical protein